MHSDGKKRRFALLFAAGDGSRNIGKKPFPVFQRMISGEVGRYAATDWREFIAETTAGLMDGKKYTDSIHIKKSTWGISAFLLTSRLYDQNT